MSASTHDALEMAAVCRIQTQRFAEAVPILQRIVSSGRARATTHYNLSVALAQVGRPDEAVGACLRAYELAPEEARVLTWLVQLLRSEGRETRRPGPTSRELRQLRGS